MIQIVFWNCTKNQYDPKYGLCVAILQHPQTDLVPCVPSANHWWWMTNICFYFTIPGKDSTSCGFILLEEGMWREKTEWFHSCRVTDLYHDPWRILRHEPGNTLIALFLTLFAHNLELYSLVFTESFIVCCYAKWNEDCTIEGVSMSHLCSSLWASCHSPSTFSVQVIAKPESTTVKLI